MALDIAVIPAPVTSAEEAPKGLSAADLVLGAARIRSEAEANPYATAADFAYAEKLEKRALAELELPDKARELTAGGELHPLALSKDKPDYVNTVLRPNYVTAAASRDRLDLLHESGALEEALDLADTIEAKDSLERMLCHQMATAHRIAMKYAKHVERSFERMNVIQEDKRLAASAEAARNTGAMTRAMLAFQQGAATLKSLRSGGRQTVIVQHVHVSEGGQAMVNGRMSARGGGKRRKGGNSKK